MINILTGVVASISSWILNKLFLSKLGAKAVIYLIPLEEEVLKTGLAYYLEADLISTHLVFGLLEASFDFVYSNSLAALLALLTHLLLGLLTVYLWQGSDNLIVAVAIAVLVHAVWNYSIRRSDHEIDL